MQVYYPISDIIPDWQPPIQPSKRAISDEVVPELKKSLANGKTLRELSQENRVSHETIRSAVNRCLSSHGAAKTHPISEQATHGLEPSRRNEISRLALTKLTRLSNQRKSRRKAGHSQTNGSRDWSRLMRTKRGSAQTAVCVLV